jgi:hypothetical protein
MITLVDMFEERLDRREDILHGYIHDIIDLVLICPSEVLLIVVAFGFDLIDAHLQQIAICTEVI